MRSGFILSILLFFCGSVYAANDQPHKIQLINHVDTSFQLESNERSSFVQFTADHLYEGETLTLYLIPGNDAFLGLHIDETESHYQSTEANAFFSLTSNAVSEHEYTVAVHGYMVGTKMAYSWKHYSDRVTITFCSVENYESHQNRCE